MGKSLNSNIPEGCSVLHTWAPLAPDMFALQALGGMGDRLGLKLDIICRRISTVENMIKSCDQTVATKDEPRRMDRRAFGGRFLPR